MTKKAKRILLEINDIKILTGSSYITAYRSMIHLKDALGKKKHQKVTISEYITYHGLNFDEVAESLSL